MLGKAAPDFSLTASNGRVVTLRELKNSYVVLVFYPMNDSPGCNKQLDNVSLQLSEFQLLGAFVFGVNSAKVEKQRQYCVRRKLDFPILSDPGGQVAKSYRARRILLPFNRRTVAIVNPNGYVCYYKRGIPTNEDLLNAIRESQALELAQASTGSSTGSDRVAS